MTHEDHLTRVQLRAGEGAGERPHRMALWVR